MTAAALPGRGDSPGKLAAAIADEAYFQYERALQKEEEPELTIHLPPAPDGPRLDTITTGGTANGALANGHATEGDRRQTSSVKSEYGATSGALAAGATIGSDAAMAAALMPPPPTPFSASQPAGGSGPAPDSRTVLVRVEYDVREPVSGVRFFGEYAVSDSQARSCVTCCTNRLCWPLLLGLCQEPATFARFAALRGAEPSCSLALDSNVLGHVGTGLHADTCDPTLTHTVILNLALRLTRSGVRGRGIRASTCRRAVAPSMPRSPSPQTRSPLPAGSLCGRPAALLQAHGRSISGWRGRLRPGRSLSPLVRTRQRTHALPGMRALFGSVPIVSQRTGASQLQSNRNTRHFCKSGQVARGDQPVQSCLQWLLLPSVAGSEGVTACELSLFERGSVRLIRIPHGMAVCLQVHSLWCLRRLMSSWTCRSWASRWTRPLVRAHARELGMHWASVM